MTDLFDSHDDKSDAASVVAIMVTSGLTRREAEVMYWVAHGKISRDVADILGISWRTVAKHLENIFQKLGVETRTAATRVVMIKLRTG